MTRPNGAPCWIDLMTSDTARAREFYAGLFGWTAGEAAEQFGGYFMFMRDGVPVAGCMPKAPGVPSMEGPDMWGVYLSSPDAKGTADKALAHGGTLREGPVDIADLGTEAVLEDAAGTRIGVWQARAFPGISVFGEPGTPAYFELITRDYEPSVGFYRDVFGWEPHVASDTPEFRLTALRDGGETIAGIMDGSGFLPAGQTGQWTVYVKVTGTDAALAKVTELGGTVTQPAMDTPYGRLAGATDPGGAMFKLVS
jgi:predicted enzyme related to lactoylglutathione lyase